MQPSRANKAFQGRKILVIPRADTSKGRLIHVAAQTATMGSNLASSRHLSARHGALEILGIIVNEEDVIKAQPKLGANARQPVLRAFYDVLEDVRLLFRQIDHRRSEEVPLSAFLERAFAL